MRPRCGGCLSCLKVEEVRQQAFRALSCNPGNGDAVALIWNTTLQEYPCVGEVNALTRKAEARRNDSHRIAPPA